MQIKTPLRKTAPLAAGKSAKVTIEVPAQRLRYRDSTEKSTLSSSEFMSSLSAMRRIVSG